MGIEGLLESVEDAIDDGAGPVLSVYIGNARDGESREGLRLRLCLEADVPHRQIRETTVGRLSAAGITLVHSVAEGEPLCHFHILFAGIPSIVDLETLVNCFDSPIPNPAGEYRRQR